jgi:hypothetical protein
MPTQNFRTSSIGLVQELVTAHITLTIVLSPMSLKYGNKVVNLPPHDATFSDAFMLQYTIQLQLLFHAPP